MILRYSFENPKISTYQDLQVLVVVLALVVPVLALVVLVLALVVLHLKIFK